MTANPPPVKVLRADAPDSNESPPTEKPGEIERILFPRWLDHDSATGGPDYVGYVMWLITFGLLAVFIVLALFVVW